MTTMILHPEEKIRPATQRRYLFPTGIFVTVRIEKPTPRWFDGPKAMLRRPGFWAIMLALTILMLVGALMLSDQLRSTGSYPFRNLGRVYSALSH